jgi:hypothetical protein
MADGLSTYLIVGSCNPISVDDVLDIICIGCPAADIPLSNLVKVVAPTRVCSTEQLNSSVRVLPKQELDTGCIVPGGFGNAVPIFSIKSAL